MGVKASERCCGFCCSYASTFQMLRGTLVFFAGLLTIVLLKRRLHTHHWLGMVLIVAGAALVGASSVIFDGGAAHRAAHLQNASAGGRALHMLEVHLETLASTVWLRSTRV